MDDKLPKCGCGGAPRHGIFEEGMPGLTCDKCSIAIVRNTEAEADMAWRLAMSAQAPGMEAMREALRNIRDELDNPGAYRIATIRYIVDAALQAAERGKA